jgi:hypothetical protein
MRLSSESDLIETRKITGHGIAAPQPVPGLNEPKLADIE